MTLSVIDNSYDFCYNKAYIQKAAFIQKLVKSLIDTALG